MCGGPGAAATHARVAIDSHARNNHVHESLYPNRQISGNLRIFFKFSLIGTGVGGKHVILFFRILLLGNGGIEEDSRDRRGLWELSGHG